MLSSDWGVYRIYPNIQVVPGKEIIKIGIPLHKAIALFLDRGCPVHCEDEDGNFPLHLAVKLLDDSASKCIQTLLDYGAHFDAVNFNGQTALDLAKAQTFPPPVNGVISELTKASTVKLSLQCLASQVVAKHNLDYINILPSRIVKFVSWHTGDASVNEHVHMVKGGQFGKTKLIGLGGGVCCQGIREHFSGWREWTVGQ